MKFLMCRLTILPFLAIMNLLMFTGVRCSSSDIRRIEKRVLDNLINNINYDARIRPNGVNDSDGPVVVHVNMYIRSLSKINEADMEYSVQVTFRQQWTDSRLQYDDHDGKLSYLTLTDHDSIWKPDPFFSNEKEGHMHDLMKPNYLMRVYPNGQVLYSVRMSLVMSCPMNFKNFPMDTQTCSFIVASYGYTTEDVVFLWRHDDPVQITRNLNLVNFKLTRFLTDYCTSRTNTGEYSCLKLDLTFKRVLTYYLYQIYFPFVALVLLSWVTFWIEKKMVTARVFLPGAAMMVMFLLSGRSDLPLLQTSYARALDVWCGVCQSFAFAALLEVATVNYIRHKIAHQNVGKERALTNVDNLVELEVDKKGDKIMEPQHKGMLNWRALVSKLPTRFSKIDVLSRILFPAAFAIFNVIYWTIYGAHADDEI